MPRRRVPGQANQTPPAAPAIRIKEIRHIPVGELHPHPNNPRYHPEAQYQAVGAMVRQLGIADIVLAYQSERYNALTMLDGHLRRLLDGKQEWPVAILDFTDDEADLFLLLHDETVGMAEDDTAALQRALVGIENDDAALEAIIQDMRERAQLDDPGDVPVEEAAPPTDSGDFAMDFDHCPTCGQPLPEGGARGKRHKTY